MVKMITLKCPECGALIDVASDKSRSQYFCHYCGARILIDDGSTSHTHTYRKIDEARIREAEVRLRELEAEERQRAATRKMKIFKAAIPLLIILIGVLLVVVGLLSLSKNSDSLLGLASLIGFPVLAWGVFIVFEMYRK